MIKIMTNKEKTTYQVVDEAYGDMPENRSKIFPTTLEAVNQWLYPNNDESGVAKFLSEVPIVEEEPMPEPRVGDIPHGNIINMVMGKNSMRPETYYRLVDWCLSVFGFESLGDTSDTKNISELNNRVQKIDDVTLLLCLIEMADAGKRGCRHDQHNDDVAEAIKNACMNRLADFQDSLPPSLWHKVHRHALWQESAETKVVSLPSPEGWISFNGIRPAQHGAWSVKMTTPLDAHESPQYVRGMGLKAKNQNQYAKSHTGVECQAYHLFNHDGTLWGFEVYLISPLKTVGCEVTKDGRFSLFRKGVYLPPRLGDVRQGDALFRRIDVQKEDVVVDLPVDTIREMQSVTIQPVYDVTHALEVKGEDHRHEGYEYYHPISRPHTGVTYKCTSIEARRKEHRHEGYDYWHPISCCHADSTPYPNNPMFPCTPEERTGSGYKYENVLILDEDAVLTHPDHPSIALKTGYYQILSVEGETDYQPKQRGGD